jgi:atypical dual specificity phosphatase
LSEKPINFSWVIRGKLAGSARPDNEAQLKWLKTIGIRAIVCLNREHPLEDKQVMRLGFEYLFIPVRDFAAPTKEQIAEFVSFAREMIQQQRPVLICCGAGIGRTGTMLAAYLVSQCRTPEDALKQIQEKRGVGVESGSQRAAVLEYARYLGKCTQPSI